MQRRWMALALLLVGIGFVVAVVTTQQPPRHLVTRDCPIPPGPWMLTTDGHGNSICIDPNDPSSKPFAPVPLYTD